MALTGQNPDHSYVLPKNGSAAFRFQYQWRSQSDGSPAPVYVDEIDSDQRTVLSSSVYWLNGAISGGPPIVTPVYPLAYTWQTAGPYFQMRRAPYPDSANPADTYAGTLLNSRALVGVLAAEAQPPPPPGGGPGPGSTPTQQVVCSSSAGSGGDLDVLLRNLWLPQLAYVSALDPPQVDLGFNIVEPDGWTQLGFTGANSESLDVGWANPLVFVPANDTTQALIDETARILPGVDPITGREDGLAYVGQGVGELQLIRHIFTMPTFDVDVPFTATLTLFAKGFVVAATMNGLELPDTVALTTSTVDGTSLVQGIIPSNILVEGAANVLAIATINVGVSTGDPVVNNQLNRAQFVAYAVVVTT